MYNLYPPFVLPLPHPQKIFIRRLIEVHEVIGSFDELGRGGFAERDDFDLAAFVGLEIFDERHEVAVAGHEDHRIELRSHFDGVDGEPDVPVGFLGAGAEDLQVLDLGFDAHLDQSVEKGALFAGFRLDHVSQGADELPAVERVLDDLAEIDLRVVEILAAVVEVLRVDENSDALFFMFDYCHEKLCQLLELKLLGDR